MPWRYIVNQSKWWEENFGLFIPRGLVLSHHFPDQWTRIHSLPDSKRYADSKNEYDILLQRHNELTDYLFQAGEECILIKFTGYDNEDPCLSKPTLYNLHFSNEYSVLGQYPGEIPTEDDDIYSVWYANLTWKPSFFNKLVKDVTDEKEWNIAIVSLDSRNLYYLYDGGADVLTFNCSKETLRHQFSNWLSDRPDGL